MLGNTLKARPSQNMCPLGSTLGRCLLEGGHAPQVLSSTQNIYNVYKHPKKNWGFDHGTSYMCCFTQGILDLPLEMSWV
jgi:hypothetical protein